TAVGRWSHFPSPRRQQGEGRDDLGIKPTPTTHTDDKEIPMKTMTCRQLGGPCDLGGEPYGS
ncbi:MAG TPA: hypothetical protein VIR30_02485, partial [Nocardioides sp.]